LGSSYSVFRIKAFVEVILAIFFNFHVLQLSARKLEVILLKAKDPELLILFLAAHRVYILCVLVGHVFLHIMEVFLLTDFNPMLLLASHCLVLHHFVLLFLLFCLLPLLLKTTPHKRMINGSFALSLYAFSGDFPNVPFNMIGWP
jgi:hypothetical protein